MSVLKDTVMEALIALKPRTASTLVCCDMVYASGCGCTGDCGQSCKGTCETGCSGNCGRSCYGSCS